MVRWPSLRSHAAAAVGRRGKLSLDDKVSKWLPDLRYADQVTPTSSVGPLTSGRYAPGGRGTCRAVSSGRRPAELTVRTCKDRPERAERTGGSVTAGRWGGSSMEAPMMGRE